jgi:hypothetical protein
MSTQTFLESLTPEETSIHLTALSRLLVLCAQPRHPTVAISGQGQAIISGIQNEPP